MRGYRGGGGGAGGPDPTSPEKSQKITKMQGFLSNTGPDPLKITKLQSHIQCLNGVRWRADDGMLIVVCGFWILPLIINEKKSCQSWTPSDKTFWIRACEKNDRD